MKDKGRTEGQKDKQVTDHLQIGQRSKEEGAMTERKKQGRKEERRKKNVASGQ
jgi:hypothetical protein